MANKPLDAENDQPNAEWLMAEFAKVSYSRQTPVAVKTRQKPRQGYFALAASIAAVTVVVTSVMLPEPTTAWAAAPKNPTASEQSLMLGVCSQAISRGLGELQGSGSASPGNENAASSNALTATPPTALPPLIAIDRRGTGAVALFEDKQWRVTCPLRLSGSTWTDQGITVEGISATPNTGTVSLSKTVWADGTGVTVESGQLEDPQACLSYKTESGEKAQATCSSGRYLIWYPDSVKLDRNSPRFNK
jgi:hypothetical protein